MTSFNDKGSTWYGDTHGAIPARFRRIKARVAARDRDWFVAHPRETYYVRPYTPGEFWPHRPPVSVDVVVLVTLVAPGIRTRQALAHVVKGPGIRMTVVDPSSGSVLPNVPMEGWNHE